MRLPKEREITGGHWDTETGTRHGAGELFLNDTKYFLELSDPGQLLSKLLLYKNQEECFTCWIIVINEGFDENQGPKLQSWS